MRMIGIGLLGFLLAGVALLLSTMNIWERGQWAAREWVNGPQLVFEVRATAPVVDENQAIITRSNPDHPVILSGLPAYQGVTFDLPVDARPTSGYLQIDATFQVLAGVEGVLRVSIDNVRRGEMLLHPGEAGRSLQVPLSPTDLVRDQLVVSFSLQGEGPGMQCRSDVGLAAIVEIETTSAIFVKLDRPLTTVRDRISAWGQTVRVGWPEWLQPDERVRRLALATAFKQTDVDTVFIDVQSVDALTTLELREALPAALVDTVPVEVLSWPRDVARRGSNAGLRRFHRKTQWRIVAEANEADAMTLPSRLDLNLALGRQPNESQWVVTITLNDRLLHQDFVDRTETHFATTIALPPDMLAARNTIEVMASTTHTPEGQCNDGPELIAEMLPTTRLYAAEEIYSDDIVRLRNTLADIGSLSVSGPSAMTATDASVVSDLLAEVMPVGVTLKPATQSAQLVILAPNEPMTAVPNSGQKWLVIRDEATRMLIVYDLAEGTDIHRTGLALLIVPGTINVPGLAL